MESGVFLSELPHWPYIFHSATSDRNADMLVCRWCSGVLQAAAARPAEERRRDPQQAHARAHRRPVARAVQRCSAASQLLMRSAASAQVLNDLVITTRQSQRTALLQHIQWQRTAVLVRVSYHLKVPSLSSKETGGAGPRATVLVRVPQHLEVPSVRST
eukprot:CAMPEP_0179842918 /NCGR_PEP_ID=MMETSP0982-20121206/3398_1 /TAXON_ID=483367 /ORGANISM="non described non described, Strain CCMP 2436" /LENGTH=158 /DNA_ID=CAMNT_0021727253 /DNA_START=55 /DNA_END=532 /DNA_ORIENTATION=+